MRLILKYGTISYISQIVRQQRKDKSNKRQLLVQLIKEKP